MAGLAAAVKNLIVDDFQQLEFNDPETGKLLRYNLFVPKNYDPAQSYPWCCLCTCGRDQRRDTDDAFPGLGRNLLASPEDQAMRPAFVGRRNRRDHRRRRIQNLGRTRRNDQPDQTLAGEYSIDSNRSMRPAVWRLHDVDRDEHQIPRFLSRPRSSLLGNGILNWFARWRATGCGSSSRRMTKRRSLARTPCRGAGGGRRKDQPPTWNARWNADQFRFAFDDIDAEGSRSLRHIRFPGTVNPEGESSAGGQRPSQYLARRLYDEPIREWIFRQSKG
jgi:hypothetical protein